MKKAFSFLLASIAFCGLTAPVAIAEEKIHVSFVMVDPTTGKNVGSGSEISLFQVNRNDHQQGVTNEVGAATFNIAPTDYILSSSCKSCRGSDYFSYTGTQYLISPQSDGKVKILSAADDIVTQDSSGNFIISIVVRRKVVGTDPWQVMTHQPNFNNGGPEHVYVMTNGKVLMQSRDSEGFDSWWLLTPDKNGSYLNGSWSQPTQPPAGYNPQNMNGAVLHSGNFIVVGGEQNTNASGVMEENTNQSYIFNPQKNVWTSVVPPNDGKGEWATIGAAPFVELANGLVMVGRNGSTNQTGLAAMLYDESKDTWTLTGVNKTTSNNEEGYTLLANDKVLSICNCDDANSGIAEAYDPAIGLWAQTARSQVALGHGEIGPAITIPNGKVLAMGATGHNALYDPVSDVWTPVPDFPQLKNGLQEAAADNEAVVLPTGNVLVITSVFTCSTNNCYWMAPARWFEYDVQSNSWLSVVDDPGIPSSSNIANGVQAVALPNGQVMVTGAGQIEFYAHSGLTNSGWVPVVDSVSSNEFIPGNTYTLSGKQLSGLTQGSHWGDEQQNATNYGLVQITNKATNHISYARSFDFSNSSIGANNPSSLKFTVEPSIETGPSSLRVIASGFASSPIDVYILEGTVFPTLAVSKKQRAYSLGQLRRMNAVFALE
jgi:hypothetical protein